MHCAVSIRPRHIQFQAVNFRKIVESLGRIRGTGAICCILRLTRAKLHRMGKILSPYNHFVLANVESVS